MSGAITDLFTVARTRYCCKSVVDTILVNLPVHPGKLGVPIHVVSHLLPYLFVLQVPAYRIRWHVPVSLATIESVFRIFRRAIHTYIHASILCGLQEIKQSYQIELDEALSGGRRKGGRREERGAVVWGGGVGGGGKRGWSV